MPQKTRQSAHLSTPSPPPFTPDQPPTPPQLPDLASQPQSTPLVKKTAKDFPCTSGHVYRDVRVTAMAEEAEGHILGPMPLGTFVETFLPKTQRNNFVSKSRRNTFRKEIEKMESCKLEKEMYPIFVKAAEDLCPIFPPVDTHSQSFKDFHGIVIKPDVCFYPKKFINVKKTGISAVEMIAEFKIDLNDDAFVDDANREAPSGKYIHPEKKRPREDEDIDLSIEEEMALEAEYEPEESEQEDEGDETDVENEDEDEDDDDDEIPGNSKAFQINIAKLTIQGRDTLGQITSYATAQKSAQFRTHIFSMLVFKQHARLLYWDNAGLVVTERFHLANGYFAEFLGRYNKSAAEERGHDVTARRLTKKELDLVRDTKVFTGYVRLVKLSTASGSTPGNFYLAERVTYMGGTSPFGRSTRGFIGYSYSELLKKKGQAKKVFIKDTWRVIGRLEEHTFYTTLHEENVPYIPSVLKALDIEGQQTVVQGLCEEKPSWAQDAPKRLRGFQHYRLLLNEVGLPLTQYSSTKHLATVIYQALQAHDLAHRVAKILHRDISVGNIMIREAEEEENRTAMLVDWDMAKSTDDQTPSAAERTGTWQFAAARLLEDPSKSLVHTLQDDLESFVHVLTWIAFRYTKNAFTPATLYFTMHSIFDQNYVDGDQRVGGKHKQDYLMLPRILNEANIQNRPLRILLKNLKRVIATRYLQPDTDPDYSGIQDPILNYEPNTEPIKTSKGMIEIFRRILETGPWPVGDVAEENPMAKPPSTLVMKGSSEVANHIAIEPLAKKPRISDVSERSENSFGA